MSKSVWKLRPDGKTVRRRKGSKSPPFVMMQKYLLTSAAWRSLRGAAGGIAVRAYLELACRYDGCNNGQLHLSIREIATLLGCTPRMASSAMQLLRDRGFIEIARHSGFNVKDRRRQASEYRLTVYPCDVTHKLPSKAFMKWQPATPKKHFTVSPGDTARYPQGTPWNEIIEENASTVSPEDTVNPPKKHSTVYPGDTLIESTIGPALPKLAPAEWSTPQITEVTGPERDAILAEYSTKPWTLLDLVLQPRQTIH